MMSWDPFVELERMRRDIDRTFEEFASGRRPFSRVTFLPGVSARKYPLVNIHEDKDALYVEAMAPGLDPDSLNLTVQSNMLTIAGEKKRVEVEPVDFHRSERACGKFSRTIELPVEVDETKVQASYKDGLILVTSPKSERAKSRQISVKVS